MQAQLAPAPPSRAEIPPLIASSQRLLPGQGKNPAEGPKTCLEKWVGETPNELAGVPCHFGRLTPLFGKILFAPFKKKNQTTKIYPSHGVFLLLLVTIALKCLRALLEGGQSHGTLHPALLPPGLRGLG